MTDAGSFYDQFYRVLESEAWRATLREYYGPDGAPEWIVPFSAVTLAELEQVATELRLREGDSFVDLGCGLGGPALWVAERTGAVVTGVDVSEEAIRRARLRALQRGHSERSTFVVADMSSTGLPSNAFAGVMSIDAVLFADPTTVVAEMSRLLRPGGTVALTSYAPQNHTRGEHWFNKWKVPDYGPYFREGNFNLRINREVAGWREQTEAFNAALRANAEQLRRELGPVAEALLGETKKDLGPRVLVVATKI